MILVFENSNRHRRLIEETLSEYEVIIFESLGDFQKLSEEEQHKILSQTKLLLLDNHLNGFQTGKNASDYILSLGYHLPKIGISRSHIFQHSYISKEWYAGKSNMKKLSELVKVVMTK
jgi:hypothetical protein